MADSKDDYQASGWLPNFKQLVLIFLTGTLLISQVPFHELRPKKSGSESLVSHLANSRLWQDPFEAVVTDRAFKKLKEEATTQPNPTKGNQLIDGCNLTAGQKCIANLIEAKFYANHNRQPINIVAVILPDGFLFEDTEVRRKIRYAVLSGFNAALRYMPERSTRIQYFFPKSEETTGFKFPLIYEWLVYKPTRHNEPPTEHAERPYERPPVLLLWLNNKQLEVTPHHKLQQLINSLDSKEYIGDVSVLGPFDSEGLQDMVNEVAHSNFNLKEEKKKNAKYRYLSPNATVQESNFLHNIEPFPSYFASFKDSINKKPWMKYKHTNNQRTNQSNGFDSYIQSYQRFKCQITNPSIDRSLSGLTILMKKQLPFCNESTPQIYWPFSWLNETKHYDLFPNSFKSLSKSIRPDDLYGYFQKKGLSFLRITATDQDLAKATKEELKLRGIEPNKKSRILLVGEWDSLYTWHLTNTFAGELLHSRETDCPGDKDENEQHWDKWYEPKDQCIFRASYLRGLDGEKIVDKNPTSKAKDSKGNNENDTAQNLEEANGDSQYDYVRRLADHYDELDRKIRKDNGIVDTHAIKAIGILGSDTYDKLLIAEAFHNKFPDAVFFTNGLDARFLEPKNKAWTRNLLVISSFDLTLNRYLQKDIPPFRDQMQSAYFLATEMALAKQFPDALFDNNAKLLLYKPDQTELDELLIPPRVFEVGRTQILRLNDKPLDEFNTLHPQIEKQQVPKNITGIFVGTLFLLPICIQPLRDFLSKKSSFDFVIGIIFFCYLINLLANTLNPENGGLGVYLFSFSFAYAVFLGRVGFLQEFHDSEKTSVRLLTIPSILTIDLHLFVVTAVVIALSFPLLIVHLINNSAEPVAIMEGTSLWPTQAIRLLALILASYFILDVLSFPKKLTQWLKKHFKLSLRNNPSFLDRLISLLFTLPGEKKVLGHWERWRTFELRFFVALLIGIVVYITGRFLFLHFGVPQVPYRGQPQFIINQLLLLGLLIPTFALLMVLVSNALITSVRLVEDCFIDRTTGEYSVMAWSNATLNRYATEFGLKSDDDAIEWINLRFIAQLSKQIYNIIGYPLIIILLIVLARSNYFDNWLMPFAFKLIIGFSLIWLWYWDYRLTQAANTARRQALILLHNKIILYQGKNEEEKNRSDKLREIVSFIENYDQIVYKPFTQRPIFVNTLLIVVALLADSIDYTALINRLLPS